MSRCAIVFSRNRALQLDGLLRSIPADMYDRVCVLWRADSDRHRDGYRLHGERSSGVEFTQELLGYFYAHVLTLVAGAGCDELAFHTDDNLWYGSPEPESPGDDLLCWTPRLGRNTSRCSMSDRLQDVPWSCRWRWAEHDRALDIGYPFALDGHLFQRAVVQRLLGEIGFTCPNDLEHRGHLHLLGQPGLWPPLISCGAEQTLVSVPANRVNDGYPNWIDGRPEWSAEALNERWLAGERLALDELDFSQVEDPHSIVEYRFEHC